MHACSPFLSVALRCFEFVGADKGPVDVGVSVVCVCVCVCVCAAERAEKTTCGLFPVQLSVCVVCYRWAVVSDQRISMGNDSLRRAQEVFLCLSEHQRFFCFFLFPTFFLPTFFFLVLPAT